MIRIVWLMLRSILFVAVLALTFLDGLSWVVLPGRVVLEILGAAGPQAGRYALLLSGVFYAGAALLATVLRREAKQGEVAFELGA